MKIISHRGNLQGPDVQNENTIESIFTAIAKGFGVEIDVWVIDGVIYFGHDDPDRIIDKKIIDMVGLDGWFHCKNLEAIDFFIKNYSSFNYFWHQQDDFTLTSNRIVWTYPGKEVGPSSIIVLTEPIEYNMINSNVYGICTDYPEMYAKQQ
jgi:glycerophosphoryl diester phosphodiesterase